MKFSSKRNKRPKRHGKSTQRPKQYGKNSDKTKDELKSMKEEQKEADVSEEARNRSLRFAKTWTKCTNVVHSLQMGKF